MEGKSADTEREERGGLMLAENGCSKMRYTIG